VNDHDPVWGTTAGRDIILYVLRDLRRQIANYIGSKPRYILDVAKESDCDYRPITLSIRELRLLRYALSVALGEERI